jgi:hypothetical protein
MKARVALLAMLILALALLAGAGSSQAKHSSATGLSPQTVLDWNANAVTLVLQAQHPREVTPPATRSLFQGEGSLYVSYVQAAVYNAAVAIGGRYEPYGYSLFAPNGASADAAVAQAAHDVLAYYLASPTSPMLTPAQIATLDNWLTTSLGAIPNGQAKTDGISVGKAAALGIEAIRSNDGRDGPEGNYGTGAIAPGAWVLTPGPFTFAQTPWLGTMHPFVLESADQFEAKAPPNLHSAEWAKDFNETKAYGRLDSSIRTTDQKNTAYFWNGNVTNQFNRELRDVVTQYGMDLVDAAHLLAAGDLISVDAAMATWHSKYTYLFWRPLTAIQNAGIDGNPKTAADSNWAPLITHPNHPEWPSAHGSVSGALTQVIAEVLGKKDHLNITIWGGENGSAALTTSRHYDSIKDIRDEVANARVWGGFHYRGATDAGLKLGEKVARWDLERAFRQVKGD